MTTIEESVFEGCIYLKSVSLPKKLKSIEKNAFSKTAITSITIPEEVYSIGLHAFWVTPLKEIYCLAPEPPYTRHPNGTVYGFPFDNETYETATVYVPIQYLETYMKTDHWGKKDTFIPIEENAYFRNIVGRDITGIENVIDDVNLEEFTEVYTINGVKISEKLDNLSHGIYIIRRGNSVSKLIK